MSDQARRILIVDGDAEFLTHLKAALNPTGCEVISASTGAEAQKKISEGEFAIAMVGLRLPDMSGIDVLETARAADPLTVGIVLTAQNSIGSALYVVREG